VSRPTVLVDTRRRRTGATGRYLLVAALVVVAVSGGWWAARATIVSTADDGTVAPEVVTAEVQEVSIGRALNLNVTVSLPFRVSGTNMLEGVVTTAVDAPSYGTGDTVYAVGGQAVRVVAGDVPFYRELAPGLRGDDVMQLQAAMHEMGYLRAEADGRFGDTTSAAVRAWQKANGEETTGTVPLGRLIAVRHLPSALRLGEDIVPAALVSGGEAAVMDRDGAPTFTLVLDEKQAALVPSGATVTIDAGDVTWPAVVAGANPPESGQVTLTLTGPGGGSVCQDRCDLVPAQDTTTMPSTIQIVPTTTGPGLPTAAVRTNTSGQSYVLMADGSERSVSVVASGDGLAVVDGVAVGEKYVVLGDRPAQSEPERSP